MLHMRWWAADQHVHRRDEILYEISAVMVEFSVQRSLPCCVVAEMVFVGFVSKKET